MALNAPREGLNYVESEGKVIQDDSIAEQERAIKADRRCMALVQKIGNSIHSSIELEVDSPSQHEDGKLPILDLKVWVETRRQSGREEEDGLSVVLHEFYVKDVASKCVINARSALPWNSKRTILTQEVLRILLNCSRELPWATVISHVNHMMLRLQYSGYDQKFRAELVRSALKAYNCLIELDASDEQPLYRRKVERAEERRGKRESWYRKGGLDTVIFVPATPGSQLKDRYTREIKDPGFKIKVVEQSGVTLKRMLQRSDPFKEKNCRNINCLVCTTGGRGPCRNTGITYELVCQVCHHQYIGEISRSAYTRGKEHLRALEQREETSVMWRHSCDKHGGHIPSFTMNVR